EELSELKQAKDYYLQALKIFAEFNDEQYISLVISQLASLDRKASDNSIVIEIAVMLKMTEAEVEKVFSQFN
ncbi:MAG: hypothetical protein AAF652_11165, partial [Cyanobacteria bacterium P01_C01_bin.72]